MVLTHDRADNSSIFLDHIRFLTIFTSPVASPSLVCTAVYHSASLVSFFGNRLFLRKFPRKRWFSK